MQNDTHLSEKTKYQDLNYGDYLDEGQFTKIDLRQKVKDITKHPYNVIGRIHCKKTYMHQGLTKQAVKTGMGCLIYPNTVLTVAHVVHFNNLGEYSGKADEIVFHHLSSGKQIKIKQCIFNQKYLSIKNFDIDVYDVAVLILQQPAADIKIQEVMTLNTSYEFKDDKSQFIKLLTIVIDPSSKQISLYQQKNTIQKCNSTKLFYRHTTKNGDSGTPILIEQSNGQFSLVGIHKGCSFDSNFGMIMENLLNQNDFLKQLISKNKITKKSYLNNIFQTVYNKDDRIHHVYKDKYTLIPYSKNLYQHQIIKYFDYPMEFIKKYHLDKYCYKQNQDHEFTFLWLNTNMSEKEKIQEFYQHDWRHLESFHLSYLHLTKIENLQLFFNSSTIFHSLKQLSIDNFLNQFGEKGMFQFVQCKKKGNFKLLKKLRFQWNDLTIESLKIFAQNAQDFSLLELLFFQGQKFGVQSIKCLNICADKINNLKSLGLQACKIGYEEIKIFAQNAQKWKNLQNLYISQNLFGDKSLTALSYKAHKFQNLTLLKINNNNIGDPGWQSFVQNGHNFQKLSTVIICNYFDYYKNKIKNIKEGDLDKFTNLQEIDFGESIFYVNLAEQFKNNLNLGSVMVLSKYQKNNPKVKVKFYQGWFQKKISKIF